MDEMIKQNLIRVAMREAQKSADEGNDCFGAVMADREGNMIGCAHNTQNTDKDPTAQAEMNLIRNLAERFSADELGQFYLASNGQSCSMCFSAGIKAGIVHYIFGAPSEPHMEPYLTVAEVVKYCRIKLDITYSVLEAECIQQIAEIRKKQDLIAN
jgi:tRNA(adenine34) deaminase